MLAEDSIADWTNAALWPAGTGQHIHAKPQTLRKGA